MSVVPTIFIRLMMIEIFFRIRTSEPNSSFSDYIEAIINKFGLLNLEFFDNETSWQIAFLQDNSIKNFPDHDECYDYSRVLTYYIFFGTQKIILIKLDEEGMPLLSGCISTSSEEDEVNIIVTTFKYLENVTISLLTDNSKTEYVYSNKPEGAEIIIEVAFSFSSFWCKQVIVTV